MPPRPLCPACLRPAAACLCGCVQPVASAVQVLVLQHPQEAGHAKNTARLLHLCLPGSRLEVGEALRHPQGAGPRPAVQLRGRGPGAGPAARLGGRAPGLGAVAAVLRGGHGLAPAPAGCGPGATGRLRPGF
ncbi:DTW domain-containing protein [Comamonas aquatica]|uniref:DTW domain-containing protein n=1 Tax=Comamonas aquatica TaxID=225991 RepID=UPI0009F4D040